MVLARDGRQTGPVSSDQLKQLAASGDLVPDDLVERRDGRWAHARSVNGLFLHQALLFLRHCLPRPRLAASQCRLMQWHNSTWAGATGMATVYHRNLPEAANSFPKAAEQGVAAAQSELGFLYNEGRGVPQNCADAMKWFYKAADQGFVSAQFNLGCCYRDGHGVSQDFAEAARWYRKAAEQGDAEAEDSLGSCYAQGQGVPHDIDRR